MNPASVTEKMPFELANNKAFAHYIPYDIEDDVVTPDPVPLLPHEAKAIAHKNRASIMQTLGLA